MEKQKDLVFFKKKKKMFLKKKKNLHEHIVFMQIFLHICGEQGGR